MVDRNLFDVPTNPDNKPSPMLKPTPDLVAEIYATAGKSFSRLAELTARLHKIQDPDNAAKANGSRWTHDELKLLKDALSRFSDDIDKISDQIKSRTVAQVRDMIRSENLASKRTSLFEESEYSKSPPKKLKKEQPDRERVRTTTVAQDTGISPTAMLDQAAAENHQLTIY